MRIHKHWFFSLLMLSVSTFTSADILFTSFRDGSSNIYVMNDNGGQVRQLTNSAMYDYTPIWSPDGSRIAFIRDMHSAGTGKGQQDDIFLMNADGSNMQRLTQHLALDGDVTWSPDGQYFAFASSRSGEIEIYVMELTSGTITQLTDNSKEGGLSAAPDWSPDGHHIAYTQVIPGGGRHIYIMDADGKNPRPILKGHQPHMIGKNLVSRTFPRWSPDGEQILYLEYELRFEPGKIIRAANRLIVVDKNGRHPKVLDLPEKWRIGYEHWAEDGAAILFHGVKNALTQPVHGKFEIYRYHLASSQITNLTNSPGNDQYPNWTRGSLSISPRGKLATQWARLKAGK